MLNRLRSLSLLRVVVSTAVVAAATAVVSATGQAGAVSPRDQGDLADRVRERFRVALLEDGVILVPHDTGREFTAIEISGGSVAIDGVAVTGRELRARVPQEADLLLALSYVDTPALRAMFGFGPAPGAAQPSRPEPPAPAPSVEPSAPPSAPQRGTVERRREAWLERQRPIRSDGRVRIGGDVRIAEDEVVRGPVVAIFGTATVHGAVEDDVVAVGGSVRLGPTAEVRGDVTSVGGTISRDSDALVRGQLNEIAFGWPRVHMASRNWPFRWDVNRVFDGAPVSLLATAMRMAFFGLLVGLTVIVARRPVERIADTAAAAPWTSVAVGVLAELAALPILTLVTVALVVSIVGIPLVAVIPPLLVIGLLLAFLMGFSGVAYGVGRWAAGGSRWRSRSMAGALVIGLLAVWAITLSGRLMGVLGWPVWGVTATLLILGFIVEYVAWTLGLGAALVTRFGTRPGPSAPGAPPPPPATEA